MDTTEDVKQFHSDGFVVLRGVLTSDEVRGIADQVDRFIREIGPGLAAGEIYYEDSPGKPVKALHGMDRHMPFFSRIREHPKFLETVRAIWPGDEISMWAVSYFGKAARTGSVTPAHQDNAFQHLVPPLGLELTIAIDESTVDNGALICQRGSHNLGTLPHRLSGVMGFSKTLIDAVDTAAYPEIALCMKPGDICVHGVNTIHRSGANKSDRPRRQLGIGYRSARAKLDSIAAAKHTADLEALHASAHKA